MKTRIYISLILALLYFSLLGFYNFYHAPLAGYATAQQLNDTLEGYTFAKFVRDGYLIFYLNVLFAGIFGLTWLSYLFSNKNKN